MSKTRILLAFMVILLGVTAQTYYCSIFDECYDCIDNNCKWCMNSTSTGSCFSPLEAPTCTYYENGSACPYDRVSLSSQGSTFIEWLVDGKGWQNVAFAAVIIVCGLFLFFAVPTAILLANVGAIYGKKLIEREIRKRRLQKVQPLDEVRDDDL